MGPFTTPIKTLDDLFVHTLQDIYYAENQILKSLPKMAEKASDPQLRQAEDLGDHGYRQPVREISTEVAGAALDPLVPVIRYNIADALRMLGREEEAIPEYQHALTLDPDMSFTLWGLCAAYAAAGRLQEARAILRDRLIAARRTILRVAFLAEGVFAILTSRIEKNWIEKNSRQRALTEQSRKTIGRRPYNSRRSTRQCRSALTDS